MRSEPFLSNEWMLHPDERLQKARTRALPRTWNFHSSMQQMHFVLIRYQKYSLLFNLPVLEFLKANLGRVRFASGSGMIVFASNVYDRWSICEFTFEVQRQRHV